MQTLRLSTGAAALAVGTLVMASVASPALANHRPGHNPPGQSGANCPNPAGKYPPGQCKKAGVSDNSARPGQSMTATTQDGEFTPGEDVEFGVRSKYQKLGVTQALSDGSATATITVPKNLSSGTHNVIFTSLASGKQVAVPFTVTRSGGSGTGAGSSAGAAGGTPSSLPFTGSGDLIPLTAVGIGMVAVGAGVVVAARRRRSDLDVSNVA